MTKWPKNPDYDPHPAAVETPPPAVIVVDPQATTRQLSTIASPSNSGMTSGDGVYPIGATVTAHATPNVDQHFVNWTYINGLVASVHPDYTFSLTSDTDLVANFAEGAVTPPEPELQGPLNLFIEHLGTAEALNRAHATKERHEQLGFVQPEVKSSTPPVGTPISPGGPIDTSIDGRKYMIDYSVAAPRRRR